MCHGQGADQSRHIHHPADVERQFNEAQARQESFWFRVNVAERGTGGSGSVQDSDIILYIALPIDIDLPPT